MAQGLKTRAALPKKLGSIPSTYVISHTDLFVTPVLVNLDTIFWPLKAPDMWYPDIKHPHKQN